MRKIIVKYLFILIASTNCDIPFLLLVDLVSCDNEMKLGEHKIAITRENI